MLLRVPSALRCSPALLPPAFIPLVRLSLASASSSSCHRGLRGALSLRLSPDSSVTIRVLEGSTLNFLPGELPPVEEALRTREIAETGLQHILACIPQHSSPVVVASTAVTKKEKDKRSARREGKKAPRLFLRGSLLGSQRCVSCLLLIVFQSSPTFVAFLFCSRPAHLSCLDGSALAPKPVQEGNFAIVLSRLNPYELRICMFL